MLGELLSLELPDPGSDTVGTAWELGILAKSQSYECLTQFLQEGRDSSHCLKVSLIFVDIITDVSVLRRWLPDADMEIIGAIMLNNCMTWSRSHSQSCIT